MPAAKKYLLLFVACIVFAMSISGQECENQYSSHIFRGASFNNYTTAINFPNNEIITTGEVYKSNGFITKFTSKGNPIWSNQYFVPYRFNRVFYSYLRFTSLLPYNDGSFLAAGFVSRSASDSNALALIAKIDKYGMVQWSKSFQSVYGNHLAITNLIETADHDIVMYIGCDKGNQNFSYGKVVRMSNTGTIKWVSQLHTGSFDASRFGTHFKRGLLQTRNGDIVVADVVYQLDRASADFVFKESDLHFFALDYTNGKLKWETSYEYPRPATAPLFIPQIAGITEQADGKLRFFTSLMMASQNQADNTMKGFSILTDATGHIEDITAYYPADKTSCQIKQVVAENNSGNSTLLFDKNGQTCLYSINNNGEPLWTKSYNNQGGLYPPNCFTSSTRGYGIFMAGYSEWRSRLLLTDPDGNADCIETSVQMVKDKASLSLHSFNVITNPPLDYKDPFEYSNIELTSEPYNFSAEVECEKAIDCCKDVIDSVNINHINLCEGQTTILPDNTLVKDSGMYYISFKTDRGCDSIRYYNVHTIRNPNSLSLGLDTCLHQQLQITLRATHGFETYNWMGVSGTSNQYQVTQPGTYWVRVSNSCGSKTDSVEVTRECEFPIYMPSAFSPNGDNINDLFGVSNLNKNRFIKLTVFNRWGQRVFETTNQSLWWDGKVGGLLQETAVFIYYLEMETIDGRSVVQKGTVTLVR